ncbi:MAG: hypothetical protein KJZ91_14130 [Myxococcales bacterium]|nr:hypothetical protein [Myxococcales bacterium]
MSCPQNPDRHDIDALASFTDVEEIVRALAYAELRAIMLAWARVPVRHPSELVRVAIDRVVAEGACARGFGQRLRDAIRAETASALMEAIGRAGPVPWHRPLAPGQLGEAAGLEVIFDEAGELAGRVRGNDPRVLSTAVALTDYVRSRRRARLARGTTPP